MDLSFAHPGLLAAGLACALLPIAIHLIRRRRPPMRWGAMRFLAEALRRQRRRLRLEQLLLLAARCLLLALLGMAIARPSLGGAGLAGRGGRTLVIVLDDTITAGVRTGDGRTEFDRSRDLAAAALDALDAGAGDRAAVVTLSAPASGVVATPSADLMGVKRALLELTPTDAAADWAAAVRLARAATEGAGRSTVLIASALREGTLTPGGSFVAADGTAALEGVEILAPRPAQSAAANIAVRSVLPRRPVLLVGPAAGAADRDAPVRVALRRFGPAVAAAGTTTVRVRSDADAAVVGRAEVRWSPGQADAEAVVPVAWPAALPARALPLRVEIDPDALPGDDASFAVVETRRTLRVAVVARRRASDGSGLAAFGPADWLRAALAPSELSGGLEPALIDPALVSDAALRGVDAAVLADPAAMPADAWDRLGAFVLGGGLLVVFPSPGDSDPPAWAERFERLLAPSIAVGRAPRVLTEPRALAPGEAAGDSLDAIAAELGDLARSVRVSRALSLSAGDAAAGPRVLLALSDGSPWLVEHAGSPDGAEGPGRSGRVLLAASALDLSWTDLPARPLFVALLQELVRRGVGASAGPRSLTAGEGGSLPRATVRLEALPGSAATDEALSDGVFAGRRAGAFVALDRGGAATGAIAVTPDTRGSATEPGNPDAAGAWLGGLSGADSPGWLDAPGDADAVRAALRSSGERTPLWTILLIAAAVLALAELTLGRHASHAEAPVPQRAARPVRAVRAGATP